VRPWGLLRCAKPRQATIANRGAGKSRVISRKRAEAGRCVFGGGGSLRAWRGS
jgi:hypothetical protein